MSTMRTIRQMRVPAAACLLLAAFVSGCAAERGKLLVPPQQGLQWPLPPDEARVRYLGEFKSSADLKAGRTAGQAWNELLYGPAAPSAMARPHAVAVSADGYRLAVADTDMACVHVFDTAARTYRRVEDYGGAGQLPVGVAWDGDSLWIADARLHAVAVLPANGSPRMIGADVLRRPASVAFCADAGMAFVTDAAAHGLAVFDRQGRLVRRFGSQGTEPGQFNYPAQVACGTGGILAVADAMNFRVQLLQHDGTPLQAFGRKGDAPGDFALPKGVAFDPDGNLWVVDAHFENVQAFTPMGGLLMVLGGEGQGPGQFWLPAGICVDARRRIWIADTYNRRVQVLELLP